MVLKNIPLSFVLILLFVSACDSTKKTENNYVQYVNPLIGTDFTGNTYPGAQVPFGMVQLSPDNGLPGWDRIAGYFYPDSTIAGFSHTHLSGTGAGDLYDVSFMPVTLPYREAPQPLGIYSSFSHDDESVSAGYYQVLLKDYGIHVELTATERCGIQRYTFPEAEAAVFLNLKKAMNWDFTTDSYIEVIDSVTVRGYRFSRGWSPDQRVYFQTRFSKPFTICHIDTTAIATPEEGRIGTAYVARFDFGTKEGEQILVNTGISGVSMEGAALNLKAEVPDNNFDRYRLQAEKNWDRQLSKIEVKGGDRDDLVKFYTALYHTMIAPTIYSDADGSYFGPDKKIHKTDGWVNYSTFSLWDTYRAAMPLMTILHPEKMPDVINTMLAIADEQGRLPVWHLWGNETDCMVGNPGIPVVADAIVKGIGGFDRERAFEALVRTAMNEERGNGLRMKYGYIPCDLFNEAVAYDMEYALADGAVARAAEALGKSEEAARFTERSHSYRHYFDPTTGFMRGRDSNGGWRTPFNPFASTHRADDYCEGNAWQYTWLVPHDVEGLAACFGSREAMIAKLDSLFTVSSVVEGAETSPDISGLIGQYAHGNEPSHHTLYLYTMAGEPWKTADKVREVLTTLYHDRPDGLSGNEDVGQMSAWYVLSSLGFYEVEPAGGRYWFGVPLFDRAEVTVPGGSFVVEAANNTPENRYIQRVTLNGAPYDKPYIDYRDVVAGGCLRFEMGPEPVCWYTVG